jgi:predicted kinase
VVTLTEASGNRKPLIMICGKYGSGKTTAAGALHSHLPAYDRIGIDETREGMGFHVYRQEDTPLVLERMCRDVELSLSQGRGVIVERPHQTFGSRMLTYESAMRHSRRIVIVETVCPEETARSRMASRDPPAPGAHSPSNDPSVYDRIKRRWEDIGPDFRLFPLLSDIASYVRFDTVALEARLMSAASSIRAFSSDVRRALEGAADI